MKSFIQFILENSKEIVKYDRRVLEPKHDKYAESEQNEVIHEVYQALDENKPKEMSVSDYLRTHEDPHGVISGIVNNMTGTDLQLAKKHSLHTPEGISRIHTTLSDPDYLRAKTQKFMQTFSSNEE